MIREYQ